MRWLPAILPPAARCYFGTFHDGKLVVVYENHYLGYGSNPREIVIATEQGSIFSTEVLAMTSFEGENWPQVHSDGSRLWVEWIDGDDQMTWTRQTVPNAWDPLSSETFTTIEEREYQVRQVIKSLATE